MYNNAVPEVVNQYGKVRPKNAQQVATGVGGMNIDIGQPRSSLLGQGTQAKEQADQEEMSNEVRRIAMMVALRGRG